MKFNIGDIVRLKDRWNEKDNSKKIGFIENIDDNAGQMRFPYVYVRFFDDNKIKMVGVLDLALISNDAT